MCTSCVMLASQVKCAAAREGTHRFTSAQSRYIIMSKANNITDCRKAIYITKIKLEKRPVISKKKTAVAVFFLSKPTGLVWNCTAGAHVISPLADCMASREACIHLSA